MSNRIHICHLIIILFLLAIPDWSCAAISVVDGFDPNANWTVGAMATQPDGKILVGGDFTTLAGQTRNYLGRLNADGSLDTSFNPAVTGTYVSIYTLAVQADGKILVGGEFTALAGQPRNNIGRLNADGTIDTTFNPGTNGEVRAITVQPDGKILVGGWFSVLAGQTCNSIGRLNANGSLDSTFNPSPNREVYKMVLQPDGKILVGGGYTAICGQTRNRIARLNPDGTLDAAFNPDANANVTRIAIQANGSILLGGGFTTLGGQTRNWIGRLNPDGSLDSSFNLDANSGAGFVVQPDGKILLGGFFTTLKGQPCNYIGRVHPDGSLDTSFNPNANGGISVLLLQSDGKVLLGGSFTSIGGQPRNYIARVYSNGSVDTTLNPGANNTVKALALQPSGKILVGGNFTVLGGQSRNYVGQLNQDGSLDTIFNPAVDNIVSAIAMQDGSKFVIGGFFATVNGQSRNGIARLNSDGNIDATFNPGVGVGNGGINAIAIQPDGKILVGGTFTTLGGQPRNYIGRLNADGSLDTAFNPGISSFSYVNTLALQANGQILVGGYFTAIGGYTRSNIGRLNADGSVDTSFSPGASGEVNAIALQPDGKIIVGGYFTTLGGSSRTRIGRLNANGSIDTAFNPGSGADNSVYALSIQSNGKIVLGGQFVQLGGQIWKSIGRLNTDGSLDTTFFNPGVNGSINALALQSDGKVLMGGTFTTFNAQSRNFIGRQANSEIAVQDLTIDIVGGKASWSRSGASPEVWRVTFEQSTDGETWMMLGDGTRVSGGWELATLSFPASKAFYIRARGYATSGGNNGSTSIYDSTRYHAPMAPSVIIGSATAISESTVTLNGTVNDNGADTTVSFEYGQAVSYGSSASGGTVAANSGATPVSAAISGLTCNTTYHFRVNASNVAGSVSGNDATFTTSACLAQNISFGTAPTIIVGRTGTVSAIGGGSGNSVIFTSQAPTVCTTGGTNGATITGVTTGTCPIAANQAGNASYAAALQVTQSFTVYPPCPTLAIPTITNLGAGSATLVLQSDSTGTGYFTLLPGSNATCGSGTQTKAGQDSLGNPAFRIGSLPLTANTPGYYTVRNLPQSTSFTVCFTAEDSGSALQPMAAATSLITTSQTAISVPLWKGVGNAGFSAGQADHTSLAFAPDGTPYVAYRDGANGSKTTVMKYSSGEWSLVGSVGFSTGQATYTSLAFAPDGTPYIAYQDYVTGSKATVMKYSSGEWSLVGSAGFSAGEANYLSLTFAPDGTPYVAYRDLANGAKATVMKYSSGEWSFVGSAGFSAGETRYTSLAFAPDGTPYVAYLDTVNDYKATVMKYSAGSWNVVGSAGFSAGQADYTSLAFAPDGIPYVACYDGAYSGKATVMKYSGGTWTTFGSAGFSADMVSYNSLAFAPDGTPYVAFVVDDGNSKKATVMKYNGGGWITVVSPSFSAGQADYTSLAIAPDGTPYVVYQDGSNGSRATVMHVIETPTPIATTGNATGIATTEVSLNGTVNDNGAATTVTFDYGLNTNYGSSASGGTVAANSGLTSVSAAISGLSCNTFYHFRVSATNTFGTTNGSDYTFTTNACVAQTITFGTAPIMIVGSTGTVSATGGGSGNPVVFTSQTPTVCTTSGPNGATVTGVATGTCTIAADQAGNAGYTAAPQVTQIFTISLNTATTTYWAANFGGIVGMNAYTRATAMDAAGNIYLAGYFDGSTVTLGNLTLTKIGSQDAFVAKLDPSGTVLWAKNFGGSTASACGNGIVVDSSGNVYLGGYFYNANLTTPALTKIGSMDVFALKLDSSGTVTWARNFGGSGASAYGNGIAVDGTGNVYLGGYFQTASLTTPALTKIGSTDAFALKLDSSGAIVWARNFGGSGAYVYGRSIAVDGSGDVYLGGDFSGANLTTPALTKIGMSDALALKLDSSGATTWVRNFSGIGAAAYGQSIAVDGYGNVYLGGNSINNLTTPTLTKIGSQDAFALKLDSSGTVTWARNFGGSGANAYGQGIAVDGTGNVHLGGYFQTASLSTPVLTKIGSQDAFALKLDSTGVTTWTKNFGGSGASVYCQGIVVDGSGNVYLGGYFNTANLTTPAMAKIGGNDALVIKLDSSDAITWAKNFPSTTPGTSMGKATATDAAGNTYLTGYFNSTTLALGSVTLTRIGTQDAFVAKMNPSGMVLWARNFGGSSAAAYSQGIAVDGYGNVYLGGYFTGANLTTPALTKIGTADAFALKLDSSGATVWAKNFGGSGASVVGKGIAVDGSGNVYLGGYFYSANLTMPALTKIGNYDAFAVKLSSTGAINWAKNFGGSGVSAYGNGIVVDSSGNVYLGGYFSGANLTTPALTRIGASDAFALKLSSTGTTIWAKNFGGNGATAYGNAITVDGSENVYLGGYFQTASLTTPALTKIGAQDTFALKLDSSGATTWARSFGGSGGANAQCYGIAVDGAGNVYLGGYFNGNLTMPALTRIGGTDAFALKLDSTGATTWGKNFGGNGASAYGYGIAVNGSGNVYIGGYYSGANLTTPALTKIGSQDAFIIVAGSISAPTATTGSASSITTTTAALNGTVNDNNAATTVIFDYGLNTNYGSSASGGSVTAGSGTTPVSAAVSGLTCNTTYHFRVTASNAAGSVSGNDATFTTCACIAQAITFGTAPTVVVGGTGTVSAIGGGAGNPVVFISQTPAVCTVSGATVTGVTTGTCTIAASQAGNAGYVAAPQVTQSFAITPNTATLTVSLLGNGGGSVNSDPSGIACTSGSSSGCSATFTVGAPFTLTALADWKSTFSGWGLPCSGTDSCILNLTGDGGVSATFTLIPRVRIPGPTPVDFAALQDAYATAGDGTVLKIKSDTFIENLDLDRAVVVTLDGGWDDTFTGIAGQATLMGTLSIYQGTAIISNLVIR